MSTTGLVFDEGYFLHDTPSSPESKERLLVIKKTLTDLGLWSNLHVINPKPISTNIITHVHCIDYLKRLEIFSEKGGGHWDQDTMMSRDSFRTAILAASGAVTAVEKVYSGQFTNSFVLARPPGHHAEEDNAMGFCLLNNVAIATRFAQRELGLKKIFILDWDAHHGNGIEKVFYEESSVMYFSIHQNGLFPRTGFIKNSGVNQGLGYNINIPLPKGSGDQAYYYIFNRLLLPVIRQYEPQMIIVAAGFDGYHRDPLTGLQLTCAGFEQMTEQLLNISNEICGGKLVFILEGGYYLNKLGDTVATVISQLSNNILSDAFYQRDCICNEFSLSQRIHIDGAIEWHRRFWNI